MEFGHEVIFVVKYRFFIENKDVIAKRYRLFPSSTLTPGLSSFHPNYDGCPVPVAGMFFDTIEEAVINVNMKFPDVDIYVLKPDVTTKQRDWVSRMIYMNQSITETDFDDLLEKYRGRS